MNKLVFERVNADGSTSPFINDPQPNGDHLENSQKKDLVIYHGNCADGFSAAWCFHHYSQQAEHNKASDVDDFEFHGGVYSEEPPWELIDGNIVYLVDFSYKRDVVKAICERAKKVWLIDHHKTAIDDLVNNVNAGTLMPMPANFQSYTDLERSGAMLAWDFLFNRFVHPDGRPNPSRGQPGYTEPPLLLDHIQDRDLWKFQLADTRAVSAAVFSYEYTFENWDMLMGKDITGMLKLTISGEAIERKHFKDIHELLAVTKRSMVIGGFMVPCASLPYTFSSDAGHIMAKEYMGGTQFAACYWDTSTHRIFSLRSTDDGVDVSQVAKGYGGGGHRNAAGFRVPRDHVLACS